MKTGLIIQGVLAAILLLVALLCVGAAQRFYPETLPFIILSGMCVLIAVTGLFEPGLRKPMFWILTPISGLLFFPFRYGMNHWPGGDDGPGMIWMGIIGGGSLLAAALAVLFLITGCTIIVRKKKPFTVKTNLTNKI